MLEAIKNSIRGAFSADAHALGAHWIYDESELKKLPIDWEVLNAPHAMWHKGKRAGDFTHYGDHTLWLLAYLSRFGRFDVEAYAKYWIKQMETYPGYIDGSSRDTLEHLQSGAPAACGPVNHDLSICGRIAPLLLVSTGENFIADAVMFAKMTHNDPTVLEGVHFFASLLLARLDKKPIKEAIEALKPHYGESIQTWIDAGIASKNQESFEVIRNFGPACGIESGFPGVIHLLCRNDGLKETLIANAKSGGDSSARAMVVGMIMGAEEREIPWYESLNAEVEIENYLQNVL